MKQTLAFDVYGTLINTSGVFTSLQQMIGAKAKQFLTTWRDKQLEYSFRRGLMNKHVDFSVVTKQALDYTCMAQRVDLSPSQRTALMEEYKVLPAFPDVVPALEQLQNSDLQLYAFSNGSTRAVSGLLENSNIIQWFDGVVSCEDVKMFKPNPVV